MNDDCEHFESFPPGHLYSSKEGALKRWYNPTWFSEAIPSAPYDPLALRSAFETVKISSFSSSDGLLLFHIHIKSLFVVIAYVLSVKPAGCDQKAND